MTTDSLFDQVAAGEITSEQAADEVMRRREWKPPRQPTWMPRWLYVVTVIAVAVVLAPILSSRRS